MALFFLNFEKRRLDNFSLAQLSPLIEICTRGAPLSYLDVQKPNSKKPTQSNQLSLNTQLFSSNQTLNRGRKTVRQNPKP